jgi:copper(I)-binding protein
VGTERFRPSLPGIADSRRSVRISQEGGNSVVRFDDRSRVNTRCFLPLLSVGVLALAACGGDDAVSVDEPWARSTTAAQANGAVYFELTVDHDDTLVGASVPASVAGEAQIHEVVEADMDDESMDDMDDESMDDMDDESMDDMDGADQGGMAPGMMMREVEGGIELTADESVTFEPGGYHVMLLDLAEPLEVGDEFELTLEFADNDDVTITVPVEETAP